MHSITNLILIGGFGFVGRNILESVRINPDFAHLSPVVVDDLSNAAPGHEDLKLPSHIGSYDGKGALDFLDGLGNTGGGRVFVFLAGETRVAESADRPLDFIDANIANPAHFVMRAVRPGDSFILISTAGALFDGTFEVRLDSPRCPKNLYGATKVAEEMILEQLVTLRGAQFSIIRLTNVFGAYSENKKSAIHAFIRAAISGDSVIINGDGQQCRDFIYAGDVALGIATLAARLHAGVPTSPVNMLGSGFSASLMDVVTAIQEAAGTTLTYKNIPATELLATEPRNVIVNKKDATALLGDSATSLIEGIRQTYAYYAC
ncbi:MAG: NAD(P)-dependent oxidoreductase [Rhodobacteraceae bacterium]|nr:NAD(P)-dependent oxidoreductase [Paracoccaceae bacterium]